MAAAGVEEVENLGDDVVVTSVLDSDSELSARGDARGEGLACFVASSVERRSDVQSDGVAQSLEGASAVFVLRPAFDGDDDEVCWVVSQSDRGIGLVAFLPSRTARAVRVDVGLAEEDAIVEFEVRVPFGIGGTGE